MDTLSNMLVMIKNASMRFKEKVDVPYSKMNVAVLDVLKEEGFIGNYKVIKEPNSKKQFIRVTLKYTEDKTPLFLGFKRISKSSRRIYRGYDEFPRVKTSFGINIVSTSKGIMSSIKAKRERIGGEVICQVW
ncbi:MAG: 30S ribosomal protein S8 [Elusimicrobiales bacterium]|nr:30S ribosomal protein S8 [Elusimicrobiales bacterium]